jgi:CheY-like chemotaxis protein
MSTSASAPERIRVSVSDTGAGLLPDVLPELFQPFNRLGRERSAEEGTGIGLVMSKRLVELMGGVIGVESTPGSGSVFWFELNSAAEPRLELDGAHPASVEVPVRHGSPVRSTLLYVEDNPANLKLIEQIIARSPNIGLLTARDGLEGIELARANQPDVILMDINLPGITGIEALKILRSRPQCERHAWRHREGFAGRILPLSHQTNQGRGIHGDIGSSTGIRGTGTRPLILQRGLWARNCRP